jgi:hypothetical protein
MRRSAPLPLALAAALLLAGCGGDGDDPKRAVDARTEALHFFPADQPFVALLDTSTADRLALARTVRALNTVPPLSSFAGSAGFVSRSGLDLTRLTRLLGDDDMDDGVAASQAALGVKPSGRPREDVLIVLVSDRSDEVEEGVEAMAVESGLEEARRFHEARVFAGGASAVAVRDGVVLIGPDIASLRAALALRDSNQDEQLDEDQVADLLNELPAQPPLVAYADFAALEATDPGVTALALGERSWMRALRETAIGVSPEAAGVRIEVFAEVEPNEGPAIPVGEQPREVEVARGEADRLVSGEFAHTSAFHNAVLGLAPFLARGSVTDEELRATIVGSR